ncbi:DUF4262 domain-containing protein [Cereibacter sphaeroides]|uniref:DUF4262 domain-containing protein n=1 Tax=Cereibacter sphaeroides TaxID=1063 RepID=UPI001F1C1CED|nr:DUF4262 domain-containing protein [Cereibacter sphaeroides]MCE6958778.1 DUF4262 domain-containing protein [Cereibacter sphaeroides]MCE6973348.1 DUF4262 domain-containing protein [Cereibacter sphaeroides]
MDRMKLIREKVAEHGWFCTAVFPREGEDGGAFAYTTGFQQTLAQPDVVMVGFDARLSHGVIASLHEGLRSRRLTIPAEGGLLNEVIREFPVKLVPVDPEIIGRFAYATVEFNGSEPTVMHQLVLPDPDGKFPGEAGVDERYERFQDIRAILTEPDDEPRPN